MAKKAKTNTSETQPKKPKFNWQITRQQKFAIGILLVLLAVALLLSFVSYFITGNYDQSQVHDVFDRETRVQNWLGKFGAYLADFFLYKGFGVASFIFVRILFLAGIYLVLDIALSKLKKSLFWDLYLIIIVSILFGFFWEYIPQLAGTVGFEMNLFIQDYIGTIGTLLTLISIFVKYTNS